MLIIFIHLDDQVSVILLGADSPPRPEELQHPGEKRRDVLCL